MGAQCCTSSVLRVIRVLERTEHHDHEPLARSSSGLPLSSKNDGSTEETVLQAADKRSFANGNTVFMYECSLPLAASLRTTTKVKRGRAAMILFSDRRAKPIAPQVAVQRTVEKNHLRLREQNNLTLSMIIPCKLRTVMGVHRSLPLRWVYEINVPTQSPNHDLLTSEQE